MSTRQACLAPYGLALVIFNLNSLPSSEGPNFYIDLILAIRFCKMDVSLDDNDTEKPQICLRISPKFLQTIIFHSYD